MQQQVVALFSKKLSDALRLADDVAMADARALWKNIGPSPSCPYVGDMMRDLHQVLISGHRARESAVRTIASETAASYASLLSQSLAEELMHAVEKSFPADHFVQAARNTQGAYQRARAPVGKFDQRAFELELSLIEVGAANSAAQTISRVRTLLEDAALKRQVSAIQAKSASQERVVSQINFNAPISGHVTVAGESINTTILNLSLRDIVSKIDASSAPASEKEGAKSYLQAFLAHPLVAALVGGIASGAAG